MAVIRGRDGLIAVREAGRDHNVELKLARRDEARKLIEGHHDRVSIAAVNGPEMLTLSGDTDRLKQIAQVNLELFKERKRQRP